jgi:predicted homoserine dehydrogenase-like protein
VAETAAFAKRNVAAGQHLDGIGGYDTFGLIVRADEARRDGLLPIGLAQYARARRPVGKDQPITYADVQIEGQNLAVDLRREQDDVFASS